MGHQLRRPLHLVHGRLLPRQVRRLAVSELLLLPPRTPPPPHLRLISSRPSLLLRINDTAFCFASRAGAAARWQTTACPGRCRRASGTSAICRQCKGFASPVMAAACFNQFVISYSCTRPVSWHCKIGVFSAWVWSGIAWFMGVIGNRKTTVSSNKSVNFLQLICSFVQQQLMCHYHVSFRAVN